MHSFLSFPPNRHTHTHTQTNIHTLDIDSQMYSNEEFVLVVFILLLLHRSFDKQQITKELLFLSFSRLDEMFFSFVVVVAVAIAAVIEEFEFEPLEFVI